MTIDTPKAPTPTQMKNLFIHYSLETELTQPITPFEGIIEQEELEGFVTLKRERERERERERKRGGHETKEKETTNSR